MAIIPFIFGGENATVVSSPEDFSPIGSKVLITLLEASDLTAENVCFDLHVGNLYKEYRKRAISYDLKEGQTIVIRPNRSVSIQTRESVNFPANRFGYILPKVDLLQRGLANTTSKVDPGYSGMLFVTVFNLGASTIRLRSNDPFCALVVHEVSPNAITYKKGAKSFRGEDQRLSLWEAARDWCSRNSVLTAILISIASLLIGFANLMDSYLFHRYH